MSFSKGDLFHIEMRNGIYQVLDFYKSDDKGNIYFFRKVFDGKLNFKVSKAEVVHDSWMSHISTKTRDKIADTLNVPEVQAVLNDLTIDRMMQYGTTEKFDIILCTMDPKSKKKLEKLLNAETQSFLDTSSLTDMFKKLHDQGDIHIETALIYPPEDKRLYRIELGRYCDDFDEFGNEQFREVRFVEVKMYHREDIIK